MMNQKIKKLWLKALRSGKYEQANGTLKTKSNKFCCLGVLCDIQGIDWKYSDELHSINLPRNFNAGLRSNQRTKLAKLNDGIKDSWTGKKIAPKHSFEQIADYIEKYL